MGAPDLLEQLRSEGFRLTAAGDRLRVAPRDRLTDPLRDLIRAHKAELMAALAQEPLPGPAAEARRRRVLGALVEHPEAAYAMTSDDDGAPEGIVLAVAIRGKGTVEFRIPRDRYDPFLLMDLIDRYGHNVH